MPKTKLTPAKRKSDATDEPKDDSIAKKAKKTSSTGAKPKRGETTPKSATASKKSSSSATVVSKSPVRSSKSKPSRVASSKSELVGKPPTFFSSLFGASSTTPSKTPSSTKASTKKKETTKASTKKKEASKSPVPPKTKSNKAAKKTASTKSPWYYMLFFGIAVVLFLTNLTTLGLLLQEKGQTTLSLQNLEDLQATAERNWQMAVDWEAEANRYKDLWERTSAEVHQLRAEQQ